MRFHLRKPFSSYTPIRASEWGSFPARSLLLGGQTIKESQAQIEKFSKKDATAYGAYEEVMARFVNAVVHLLDQEPPHFGSEGGIWNKMKSLKPLLQ